MEEEDPQAPEEDAFFKPDTETAEEKRLKMTKQLLTELDT